MQQKYPHPVEDIPPADWTPGLRRWLQEYTVLSGFDLSGIAPVDAAGSPGESLDASRFETWIDTGRAGEMEYLKRRNDAGHLLRTSVQNSMPWARSVVLCALSYKAEAPLSIHPAPANAGWIARYAWSGAAPGPSEPPPSPEAPSGSDYHDVLLDRLQHLASALRDQVPCQVRCYVDTGPMVERSLAARAGIGWIGKNTCVLNQQLGSWLLLGCIVTSLRLPSSYATLPAPDRCGSCTRCIDACPTGALIAPRQMDASRCIAYLTIEKKGHIPEDLRPGIGRQVFGCDICQDVCPWNSKSAPPSPRAMPIRPELINPDLEWLASMDAAQFRRWFKNSPVERTRRSRLHRNVAIAMGNSREARFRDRLLAWSTGDDPVLAEAALWALARLEVPQQPSAPSANHGKLEA